MILEIGNCICINALTRVYPVVVWLMNKEPFKSLFSNRKLYSLGSYRSWSIKPIGFQVFDPEFYKCAPNFIVHTLAGVELDVVWIGLPQRLSRCSKKWPFLVSTKTNKSVLNQSFCRTCAYRPERPTIEVFQGEDTADLKNFILLGEFKMENISSPEPPAINQEI